jgi:cell division septation protein DedD
MERRWVKIAAFSILATLLTVNAYLLMPAGARLGKVESRLEQQADRLDRLTSPASASGTLSSNLEYLNARVQMLNGVIADLRMELTKLKAVAEGVGECDTVRKAEAATLERVTLSTVPESNASSTGSNVTASAESSSSEDNAVNSSPPPSPPAGVSTAPEAAHSPQPSAASDGGPWVINLASLDNQAAADRFSRRAQSHGVEVHQQVVEVRGAQRWRVQVTGFASATEARNNASTIRDKLGLKEIWITRR